MKTRIYFLVVLLFLINLVTAQELYPYTEPASNMPAKSISFKLSSMFERHVHSHKIIQRHTPEIMLGVSKKWMVHVSTSFSDMHEGRFMWESARLYGKYRFLSLDDVHKHFRMAAFGALSYSRNRLDHNEINLQGDQSGAQLGLIATQLWNKLAISGSGSLNEVLHEQRWRKISPQPYAYRAFNYSLSAGYLLLPREYTDYKQTNLNLYLELLGGRNLDWPGEKFYLDLAPAIQLIFNSTSKLNLGYRFQLDGDILRLANRSFMISYEHIFLDGLRKKRKKSTE